MSHRPRTLLRHSVEIGRKDLMMEWRSGEALLVAAPFGAAALLLAALAVGADVPVLRAIGPGIYWLVVLLFGMLVTQRHTAAHNSAPGELLTLLGVDPGARFLGQAGASAVLLLAFQGALAPVAVALFDPEPSGWPWMPLLAPLVAAGLAELGTLAGQLTTGLPAGSALAPLLAVPLAVPLLLGATQVLDGGRYGRPLPWVLLVFAVDLVAGLAGLAAARSLEEVAS
jgi:heme exporter protein B